MRRCALPALLLALLTPLAAAGALTAATDPLAAISARLERPAVVRGDFVQTKRVAALSRPLVSRGRFVVARGAGVLWELTEPFPQRIRIGSAGLRIGTDEDAGGETQGPPPAAMREVSRVLAALFEADLGVLERYFEASASDDEQGWQLVLTPRSAALGQLFRRIELRGDRLLREVHLDEANGDSTGIVFENATAAEQLSDEERRALD